MKTKATIAGLFILLGTSSQHVFAWGDDGHKTVALIAQQCLTPSVKKQVTAILATDTDNLTKHDIASEATWADKFRQSSGEARTHTQNWHFTDIEIDKPDLTAACFGRHPLPAGTLATGGPDEVCAVDKVEQFQKELAAPGTDAEERLAALKFILHFVGDLHQPLHSSDHEDRGGNDVKVTVAGFPHHSKDELHGFWDTQFVDAIATPPTALAKQLLAQITPADATTWATGTPDDWAMEAFKLSKADTYGNPPLSKSQPQNLDQSYVTQAEKDVTLQLKRAGIRLASLLNKTLGSEDADWSSCLHVSQNEQAKVSKTRHRRRSH